MKAICRLRQREFLFSLSSEPLSARDWLNVTAAVVDGVSRVDRLGSHGLRLTWSPADRQGLFPGGLGSAQHCINQTPHFYRS